jgi:CRISPR-associated protein Cas2
MWVVVAYDVSQDARRQRVMNALKDYGLPVQKSVFECDLAPASLERMRVRLLNLLNVRQDRLHFYPLCERCRARAEAYGALGDLKL